MHFPNEDFVTCLQSGVGQVSQAGSEDGSCKFGDIGTCLFFKVLFTNFRACEQGEGQGEVQPECGV